MSASLFVWRLERLPEEKKEDQRWQIWSAYAQARSLYHALASNQDLPTTEQDYQRQEKKKKKKGNPLTPGEWERAQEAYNQRVEHDQSWREALLSPAHFAQFMGMPQVFGEPPQKKLATPEEARHAESIRRLGYDREEVQAREKRILSKLDRISEKIGSDTDLALAATPTTSDEPEESE